MFYRPHPRVSEDFSQPVMTKQEFKAECDIHNILRQYQRTGIITHVQNARPTYGDLPDPMDYQQALHIQMEAQEAFAGLPSKVREHFNNDPAELLAALGDPAQRDYLLEVGILRAPEPAQSVPDSVPVPQPAPASGT